MNMNTKSPIPAVLVLATSFGIWIAPDADAQEENLEMALEMQDRRTAGLKSLADKIKNFNFLSRSQKVVTKLDEKERKQDPFGLAMDPEEALPEITPDLAADDEISDAPATTLQEALQKLNVTGIFPNKGEIMVGAQNLGVGDAVLIDYKGVAFNLTIEKVAQTELVVKDTDTGETAALAIGFDGKLPEGMSRRRPEVTEEDKNRQAQTIVPMAERVVKVD